MKNITDKETLDWLSACSKIDNSGHDGGYAFERNLMTDEPVGVVDVRIATRGFIGIDALRRATHVAMATDEMLGSNPAIRASKRTRKGATPTPPQQES